MTWRDEFVRVSIDGRPMIGGSFHGVPFFVSDSSRGGGRRLVDEEIPFSDEHFTDDLGVKRRRVRLTAYVIGPDYTRARDALIEACEKALGVDGEAGPLQHPSAGLMQVVCESYECTENLKSDGGRAAFALSFLTVGTQGGLSLERVDAVPARAKVAREALGADYLRAAETNRVEADFLTPIESAVEAFAATVKEPFAALVSDSGEAAAFRSRIDDLVSNAAGIAADPALMLFGVVDSLSFAFSPPQVPANVIALAARVSSLWADIMALLPQTPYETETRSKQHVLLTATAELMTTATALAVSELAAATEYDAYDSAVAARGEIGEMLDGCGQSPGFETTRNEVEHVRATALKGIPRTESGQKLRQFFTPPETTPSILLAHRFYGSLSRELEFCARNQIANPCLVPGDVPVEIMR